MSLVLSVLRHGFGLLVDDGRLALATVSWLLLCGVVLPRLTTDGGWGGLILFAGLVAILAKSAIRRARRPE